MFIKGGTFIALCFALTTGASRATAQSFLGLGTSSQRTSKLPVKSFAPSYAASYDDGLFTPVEHLGVLSEDQFTTLSHPVLPNYSVRIKKSSDFCDATVNSYSGYIDIQARHLFFYFFESRNDPAKDDLIFWTNGGPGCSSSLGLFMELGPCRVLNDNGTVFHPESWNSNANVFFVDQPIGVGFSYADYGETVSTTEDAAKDIAAFIAIFVENFSQFKGRALHMAGESYGGRYIPVFAAEVYDQNAMLTAAGITPINLQSIMIGNGLTDFYTMSAAYVELQCTAASVFPVQSISSCNRMKQALPRCQKWLKESCVDQFDAMNCQAAADFCDSEISGAFFSTNKNPYDISKDCDGPIEETLCYPVTKYISSFLDRPSVREKLGVDPSVTGNFSSCSNTVGQAFSLAEDSYHATCDHVAALLERNVRALIYVGTYDWICNWIGNEAWTLNMEWSGKEAFGQQPLQTWLVEGEVAGKTRSAKGLTFATIDGAGHMVPYDKPKEALAMVQRWLAGSDL
ncbi:serine carboxypeptidase [Rhizopogon vinicolor AM-OR11-026]|uniref:Carboxypeptidase n=1 Tax=Rhizopogon vinicolor AM-OR11-026 TaxID=1314800 RepID=A0A1B7N9A5_9AGAM|nr:serine carboxypeptidase [Rhizopogon vinicolor AM-OR11-026]